MSVDHAAPPCFAAWNKSLLVFISTQTKLSPLTISCVEDDSDACTLFTLQVYVAESASLRFFNVNTENVSVTSILTLSVVERSGWLFFNHWKVKGGLPDAMLQNKPWFSFSSTSIVLACGMSFGFSEPTWWLKQIALTNEKTRIFMFGVQSLFVDY